MSWKDWLKSKAVDNLNLRVMARIFWGWTPPDGTDFWLGVSPWSEMPLPPRCDFDYQSVNLDYFKKLDEILYYTLKKGYTVELTLMGNGYGYLSSCGGEMWKVGDIRNEYILKYTINRIKAFPHVIVEPANEYRQQLAEFIPDEEVGYWRTLDWIWNLCQIIKDIDPKRLIAVDAGWVHDPDWVGQDDNYHPEWKYYPDGPSHRKIWESDLCDIVNIHSDRGSQWWWLGPRQCEILSEIIGKPVFNDETNRKGYQYGHPPTDEEIIRSAWLTVFVGAYWRYHGCDESLVQRASVTDNDIPGIKQFAQFWKDCGKYNFSIANHLIEGNAEIKRAMVAGDTYTYLMIGAEGVMKLNTALGNYDHKVMDIQTGQYIFEKKNITMNVLDVPLPYKGDFAVWIKKV